MAMDEALRAVPYLFLILAVSGIIAGASVLTIGKFKDTTTDVATLNTLNNVTAGLNDMAEQFPTLGIIAIMVVIIALISSVFIYFQYFR